MIGFECLDPPYTKVQLGLLSYVNKYSFFFFKPLFLGFMPVTNKRATCTFSNALEAHFKRILKSFVCDSLFALTLSKQKSISFGNYRRQNECAIILQSAAVWREKEKRGK